jgi:hypothetical protein
MTAKNKNKYFQTWDGLIDLGNLLAKLNVACSQDRPIPLSDIQQARDIIEHLLQDEVIYHNDLITYLPQQTQNNPVHLP